MYVYRHQNGTHHKRLDFVVDSIGVNVYFDSPFIAEWKHFNTEKEVKKWIIQNRSIHKIEKSKSNIAREILSNAVRRGEVIKPEHCSIPRCFDTRVCGHHYDYDLPLDVIWICGKCHSLYHQINNLSIEQFKRETLIEGIKIHKIITDIIITKLK